MGDSRNIREEIKLCRQIYPDFKEGEKLVAAAFHAEKRFLESKGEREDSLPLTEEEIKGRLRAGNLLVEDFAFDRQLFLDHMALLCEEIITVEPESKNFLQPFHRCLAQLLAGEKVSFSLKEVPALLDRVNRETELEEDLALFLIVSALTVLYRQALGPFCRKLDTYLWSLGHCPVCGERPHYGFMGEGSEREGERFLECWLCGVRWAFPRIKCPFCANENQEELGYFTVGAGEVCRVQFCRKCNHYLKIFDLRKLDQKDGNLRVHHLATLMYDLLAVREGFTPGSGLQWINKEELKNTIH